ncbi:sulfocyanin-like copper-binding protein [Alicyclobacillus ferrooxydans]|uniref:Sulfocyanin-like C-terminal domain-containing protein n=1 Tax=Alicyclobacillus ferrooxydans TaxID=471514 RepID=A0A0P9CGI0_9BACL|nr:sulfocyanin-like copper-binding protein [Alicyclobacillus ferrooxydans]KPV42139.1 hypothetical protein AN477_19005 [Alicyclobacillus ferrooxydans]
MQNAFRAVPGRWVTLAAASAVLVATVSGCGQTQDLTQQYMTVDQSTKTVNIKVIGGYNAVNDRMNFNGYANGQMTIQVPVGYTVNLDFQNNGGIPAEIGVYDAANNLAFPKAGDSLQAIDENADMGVLPGTNEKYTFVADHTGTYEMENLINFFPQFAQGKQNRNVGMWDVFKVVQNGSPQITAQN